MSPSVSICSAAADLKVAIPERYRWAINILDVKPDDTILEIGCGYGHSIALIAEVLTSGHLTAIDRSAKMVAAAAKANEKFINSGNLEILRVDLLENHLPASYFNKIFLFNINVFWMDPRDELAEIRRLLKPAGRFYIFHQPPPGHDLDEFEAAFRHNLEKYSFGVVESFREPSEAVRSLALVATPNRQ